MKGKRFFSILLTAVLVLTLLPMAPLKVAAADTSGTGGNTFADLNLSTNESELTNHDLREASQPFGTKTTPMLPLLEPYTAAIGSGNIERTLKDDNQYEEDEISSDPASTPYKYVQTVAVDAKDEGKAQSVAELYYKEEVVPGEDGQPDTYNWGIYLSLVDASSRQGLATADAPVTVYSVTGAAAPLFDEGQYYNEHTYLNLTAGDYDNDGYSEIAVYVPDANQPRLALYQIGTDGKLESDFVQTFDFKTENAAFAFTKYVYLASGDITGDNVDDLVMSYAGPGAMYVYDNFSAQGTYVYVFKSQDFKKADYSFTPHTFADGKHYYDAELVNAAAAVGNVCAEPGNVDKHMNELVVGCYNSSGKTFQYEALRYTYDSGTSTWNFTQVAYVSLDSSEWAPVDSSISDLTSVACFNLGSYDNSQYDSVYIDGVVKTSSGFYETYYESGGNPDHFADLGVVRGRFGNNALGSEDLLIARAIFHWDGSVGYVYDGIQFASFSKGGHPFPGASTGVSPDPDSSLTCGAVAAPNTDDDTVLYRYTGYEQQYADPKILAVLASPPYFQDLAHLDGGDSYVGNSSTEFSSGSGSGGGSGTTASVKAGAYFSYEHEGSILGIVKLDKQEFETEVAFNYSHETEHTDTVTKTITYGTFGGQDSVAVYTVPYDVYNYEVWTPANGSQPGFWQKMQSRYPYDPVYSVISLEQYDAAASNYGLLQVSGNVLTHTVGDPGTYPTSTDQLPGTKTDINEGSEGNLTDKPGFMGVGYGDAYTAQSVEMEHEDSTTVTMTCSVDIKAGAGFGGGTAGLSLGTEDGTTTTTSTFTNVSYTGTVVNMPAQAQSHGYGYDWKLVEYTYTASKEDFSNPLNYVQESFPVIQYLVDDVRRPPLLPEEFQASAITQDSVTLRWNNADSGTKGYQLYRYYDFDGDLAGFYPIGGELPVGTTSYTDTGLSPYTNYTYRIVSIGGSNTSVQSDDLCVKTMTDGDTPAITTQPVSTSVAAGGIASFQVLAQPAASAAANERLFYAWQRYSDGTWTNVSGDGVSGTADATLYILNAKSDQAGLYRCAVSQQVGGQAVTIFSGAAALTVDKNDATLTLDAPSGVVALGGDPITLTASFGGTQETKPTGQVVFTITGYHDPELIPDPDQEGQYIYSYSDPSKEYLTVPISGTQAQVAWTPGVYGSYEIYASYVGDTNYNGCVSTTQSLACAPEGSAVDTALRVTGLSGTLTYGDDTRTIGATVANSGEVSALTADEIAFSVTGGSADGLTVTKTTGADPHWTLEANQAGSYQLTAECTTTAACGKLKVVQTVDVAKRQIAVKAVDQTRVVDTQNAPFALELTSGTLRSPDTLDGILATPTFSCSAVEDSPAGTYGIFVSNVALNTQGSLNYTLASVQDGTLTVRADTQYTIKFRGVANGKVTALIDNWDQRSQNFTTGYVLDKGTAVRFTAQPDAGYRIQKWVVNGVEMMKSENSSEYDTSTYVTMNSLGMDLTIEVYFVPDMCEVDYATGEHGTLEASVGATSVGGGAVVMNGTAVTFTAHPDENYMVSGWTVNGQPVQSYGSEYTLTVTGDTIVQVTFVQAENETVTYGATGSGSVAAQTAEGVPIASGGQVPKGTGVIFTASPASTGSMVEEWMVNGDVVQGNQTTYTVGSVQESLNVQVTFVPAILYKVNFSAVGYGSSYLTASVSDTAIHSADLVQGNSQIVFTAHPPTGFTVKEWKLGSTVVSGADGQPLQDTSYTLPRLSSAVTVTVAFESSVYQTLSAVNAPAAVTGVANGAEKSTAGLNLPARVTLTTDKGSVLTDVAWDVENCGYDVSNAAEQDFTVDGTVTLPNNVVNPAGISLNTSVEVMVNAAVTGNLTLTAIDMPAAVTGVANGAEKSAAGLNLPAKVTLETTDGTVAYTVLADADWDAVNCDYDAADTAAQSFTVNGAVTLPANVTNPDDSIPLTVGVSVSVNAAAPVPMTLESVTTPAAITGVPNGTVKMAAALGLPTHVTLVTDAGNVSADVSWDVVNCDYDANDTAAQSFTVSGVATLPPDVFNTNNVSLTVTVSVSIKAAETSGGGGGGAGTAGQSYSAGISGGGFLPVTVDTKAGSAALDLSTLSVGLASGSTTVSVPSIPGVSTFTATLPVSSLASGQGSLTLNTGVGSLAIPGNMLSGTGLSGTAGVIIGAADTSALSGEAQAEIGDRPVVQLSLSINGRQTDWSNPDAPVTVSIPYTPTAEELANPGGIVVWYIDGSGNLNCVTSGHYDAATGAVTFETMHFSLYAVGYNNVRFTDVAQGAWYYKAVGFIAARGITSGTTATTFSPNAKLTRGQFLVLLMRTYGIAPDTNPTDNFADAGSAYYTNYLAAAKRLGITNGVGDNRFAPEQTITRQQMFTLLYNALKSVDALPEGDSGKTLSDFTDSGSVASYAQEAMAYLVEAGVVDGNNGCLLPETSTTRAQMAQVLYNLMEK